MSYDEALCEAGGGFGHEGGYCWGGDGGGGCDGTLGGGEGLYLGDLCCGGIWRICAWMGSLMMMLI